MKKMLPLSFLCTMMLLAFSTPIYAAAQIYEDHDLLNAWRVTSNGYIYTPINLTTKVIVNYEVDYISGSIIVRAWDLSASISRDIYNIFGGSLGVGKLNIRGSFVNLPNTSTYISDPNTKIVGRNWIGTQTYNGVSGNCYGESGYIVSSSKGYQLNTTGQVDFKW